MAHFSLERSAGGPLEIPLTADRIQVGREEASGIVIDESWISSVHAEFCRTDGKVVLRDLGSSNGTTVNGDTVTEKELDDGDEVGFGHSRGVFRENSPPDVLKSPRDELEQELEKLRREREDAVRALEETRLKLQAAGKDLEQAVEAARGEREKSDLARQETRDELNRRAGEKAGLEKELSDLRERRDRQERELREMQTTVAGLREQADRHGIEEARWPALREAAEAALAAVQADLVRDDLAAKARAGELKILTNELEELRATHARMEPEVRRWENLKREAAESTAALEMMRQESADLAAVRDETGRNRQEAESGLGAARNALRDLQDELAALEVRRDQLRLENAEAEPVAARTAALRTEAAALEQQLAWTAERLSGMANAPDPNWGTVHALAMGLIRMVDFAGDPAQENGPCHGESGSREGLLTLRDRLLELLREYSVEAFVPETGSVIDPADLRRITVVETRREGWKDGLRVLRSVRSGYHCLNGGMGIATLLRKAEVVAVEAEP